MFVFAVLPNSCPFSMMCVAYPDCGSLFVMYLMCSRNLVLRLLLICPTYSFWQFLLKAEEV
jgi:hypothetical protein